MSKRKSKTPSQIGQAKRWLLSWNMSEGAGASRETVDMSSSCTAVLAPLDCDMTAGESLKSCGHGGSCDDSTAQNTEVTPPLHHITKADYVDHVWDKANFSVTIHEHRPREETAGQLGSFSLNLKPHRLPSELEGRATLQPDVVTAAGKPSGILPLQIPRGRCSLFVSPTPKPHHLVFDYAPDDAENDPQGALFYLCLEADMSEEPPGGCLEALERLCNHYKSKVRIYRHDYNAKSGRLALAVFLLPPAVVTPKFPAEPTKRLDYAYHMQLLMHWWHGYAQPVPRELSSTIKRHDFNQLFDAVRRSHGRNGDDALPATTELQHPSLAPTLRAYQCQAVNWMLRKEQDAGGSQSRGLGGELLLHHLWTELVLDDETLYYNYHSGQFTKHRFTRSASQFPGGILADEMGLGKTVEVLACILAHPRYPVKHGQEEGGGGSPMRSISSCEDSGTKSGNGHSRRSDMTDQKESLNCTLTSGKTQDISGRIGSPSQSEIPPAGQPHVRANTADSEKSSLPQDASILSGVGKVHDAVDGSTSAIVDIGPSLQADGILAAHPDIGRVKSKPSCDVGETIAPPFSKTDADRRSQTKTGMSLGEEAEPSLHEVTERKHQDELPNSLSQEGSLFVAPENRSPMGNPAEMNPAISKSAESVLISTPHINSQNETVNIPAATPGEVTGNIHDGVTCPVESGTQRADMATNSLAAETTRLSRDPCGTALRFECICGSREDTTDRGLCVECRICGGRQHSKCVNVDERSPGTDHYLCPMCCVKQPAIPSGATLIISPKTICHQWVDEINRHILKETLDILVYEGVRKHGFLQPRALANHDIVITTYETLRSELNYVGQPHTSNGAGRQLRHAKRYMALPSPLPAVEWWRVCLDEAQMVECPTAKVAEMALHLTAVNRWCVTGTPIQKDLENLYGLFLFLGVEPYWVKSWWDSILYKPYLRGNQEPMERALAKVLWRSAKKDVIHQIDIPVQTEQTHWLSFSPIETHFYRRKHEDCARDLLRVAGRLAIDAATRIAHLDRESIRKLMNPLLRLRQACCHPQAVRGEFISMQRATLTMAELLQSLTDRTRTELEEAHRQLVCALNGLAAVCLIKNETLEAIQYYRDVLQSADEHQDRLKTDSLQRLHALHNLRQLLQLNPTGVTPTLRDGVLDLQSEEIRDAYLARAQGAVQTSVANLGPLQEKISELKAQFPSSTPWWMHGLQSLRLRGLEDELIDRIKNTLTSTSHVDNTSVVNRFATIQGLQMVLVSQMDDLNAAYRRLGSGMERLIGEPVTMELVAEATDCHLRPFGGKAKNRCSYCRVQALFTEYETCLFSIKQRDLSAVPADSDDDDPSSSSMPRLQGSWAASETERILRSLLAFLRQHDASRDSIVEEGTAQLEMLDVQKKEFKSLRVTWTMLCERVAAWDELKMATMRLRLREPHDPVDISTQPNVVEPEQLDQQRYKLLNDRLLAQTELKKKLGQLVYLKSLHSNQADMPGGINPDPCPICVRELGKEWTVLPCGHSFCNSCMVIMRELHGGRRKFLRCAICRSTSSVQEISYVSTEPTEQPNRSAPVKGGYSTKVEAVITTLHQLRDQDPTVKVLVFSTWVSVLTVIAKALTDNHIEYRSIGLSGDRHFKENLMDFKQEAHITVLLLGLQSGSKGLNIVEATHVFLIEPILNPAGELQAVGRVHRIGQTRPTYVHRFLVRDTIEENLHIYLQAKHTSASLDNLEGETSSLTVENLKQLFSSDTIEPDVASGSVGQEDVENR